MNKIFDTAKVIIKDKEYNFIKPKTVFIIRLEDECYSMDGSIDLCKFIEGHLKFVDRNINIETFDTDVDRVIEVGDKKLTLKDTTVRTKIKLDGVMIKGGKLNRVDYVQGILSICEEEYKIDDFSYNEINEIVEKYSEKVDSTEVMEVFETIKTFL